MHPKMLAVCGTAHRGAQIADVVAQSRMGNMISSKGVYRNITRHLEFAKKYPERSALALGPLTCTTREVKRHRDERKNNGAEDECKIDV
jgi:hypothetical protein